MPALHDCDLFGFNYCTAGLGHFHWYIRAVTIRPPALTAFFPEAVEVPLQFRSRAGAILRGKGKQENGDKTRL
jgi:hypothetical protein